MHIALTGYYGFGNAGDDAILVSIVFQIRADDPAADITVITYPGGDLAAVASLADCEVVDGADIAGVDQAIRSAEALVVGGGGLIQDYLPSDPTARFSSQQHNLGFWTTLAIIARARSVPVMTWAIGIGPLTTAEGRAEAELFFSHVDQVTVRDEASAELARELGVASPLVAADPALLLAAADADPIAAEAEIEDLPTGGALRVVVSVRHWGDDEWMDGLAAGLDRLVADRDADVIFVPFQQSGRGLESDALVSTKVAARMSQRDRRSVLGTDLGPAEKLAAIATADLVIGMRLHSVVFAAIAGVPVVGLEYDPKVRIAMDRLGIGDQVLALGELSPDRLVEAAAVARPAEASQVARLKEAAAGPVGVLRSLLAQPRRKVDPALAVTVDAAVLRAAELASLQAEHGQVVYERDNSVGAYDKLAREYQTVLDSRAVKAVGSLWSLREQLGSPGALLRRAVLGVARRILPGQVRTRLGRRFGGSEPDAAPRLTSEELAAARDSVEADLERFVATYADGPGYVVLPPSIGWRVHLFQRPQQIALAFARLGYGVLYHLEPKYAEGRVGYETVEQGVLAGFIPDELVGLLDAVPRPIYLSYVYNFGWRKKLADPITVYEHIDDLEVFEHVYKRDQLDEWHERALAEADVVAASAMDLLKEVRGRRPDSVLVANGVDFDHFAGDHPRPDDLAMIPEDAPVVGYYGALAEWFDYDLLTEAARRLEDHHFVLIGPDYDGTASQQPALQLPNVHWLGTRPYATLPGYLQAFTVATIPFVVNEVTHAVSPLKLFEYMAGGKPVVTPPLRECARYRAVQIGDGVDGFVAEIRRGVELSRDPAHVDLLRRTARANTWEARARTIIEAVESR